MDSLGANWMARRGSSPGVGEVAHARGPQAPSRCWFRQRQCPIFRKVTRLSDQANGTHAVLSVLVFSISMPRMLTRNPSPTVALLPCARRPMIASSPDHHRRRPDARGGPTWSSIRPRLQAAALKGTDHGGLDPAVAAFQRAGQSLGDLVPHVILIGIVTHAVEQLLQSGDATAAEVRRCIIGMDRQASKRAMAHIIGVCLPTTPQASFRFRRQTKCSCCRS